MNARMLELEEYLMATTSARLRAGEDARRDDVREVLRLHRFQVFAWLLENGVKLPPNLVADSTHPPIGQMSVDKPYEP